MIIMKRFVLAVLTIACLSGCSIFDEDVWDYDEDWFASGSAPPESAR